MAVIKTKTWDQRARLCTVFVFWVYDVGSCGAHLKGKDKDVGEYEEDEEEPGPEAADQAHLTAPFRVALRPCAAGPVRRSLTACC